MQDNSSLFVVLVALVVVWMAIENFAPRMPFGRYISMMLRWFRQTFVTKPTQKIWRKYKREIICLIVGAGLMWLYTSGQQPVSPPYP